MRALSAAAWAGRCCPGVAGAERCRWGGFPASGAPVPSFSASVSRMKMRSRHPARTGAFQMAASFGDSVGGGALTGRAQSACWRLVSTPA